MLPTSNIVTEKSPVNFNRHAPTKFSILKKFTKDAPQASRGEDHKSYSWGEEGAIL